jgi:predicted nucleic acid-binding protein
MAAEPIFLDTSVIVPASVEVHPSHAAATAYVQSLVADAVPLCLSPQVCREFMVVLTRQPVSGRSFTVDEALNALEHWRSGCALLEETDAAFVECCAWSASTRSKASRPMTATSWR